MDYGISETTFWESTLAELRRMIESKQRIQKREAREKAAYDYILADLVGRSVARVYSSSAKFPAIEEAYPAIYSSEEMEEKRQQKKDELTIIRLKQFSKAHNQKFKQEVD